MGKNKYAAVKSLPLHERVLAQMQPSNIEKKSKSKKSIGESTKVVVKSKPLQKQVVGSAEKKKRVHRGKASGSWTKPRTRKRKHHGQVAGGDSAAEPKTKKKKQNELIDKNGVDKVSKWLSVKEDKKPDEKQKVVATDATQVVDASSNEALIERLAGSRFRFINEQLYTMTGSDAQAMFAGDPEAFEAYHKGYEVQVTKWPKNPLDSVLAYLRKRVNSASTIVDMGCGAARLADSLCERGVTNVYSYDLHALNERVTVADMAHLPLESDTCDYCVFCLSLMGTNTAEYLREANRILKVGGTLIIAEIRSRIVSMKKFMQALIAMGFAPPQREQPVGGDMFVLIISAKTNSVPTHRRRPPGLNLQPCLYKKR